jgi:glycosyltransferase involved in cell wall biosynthesis
VKILFVDQNSSLGGGQRVLLDLMNWSLENGHSPFLMLPDEGYVTKAAAEKGIPFFAFPFPGMTAGRKNIFEKIAYPPRCMRASNRISNIADELKADLIFANGPRIFLPCVMAGKGAGVPVHLQLHLLFERGAEKMLISHLLKSDVVRSAVACSKKVSAPFTSVKPGKMQTVPYWVSPEFLSEPSRRAEIRNRLGIGGSDIAAGVIGRISPTKGQRLFLNALLPLLTIHPSLRLVVAGSSDFENKKEEDEIKKLASGFPGGDKVRFTGMIEGRDFYDGMDILVVPSVWEEPFGLVSVEGMARSLPVVVTKSGALQEIVEDGVTGFVVPKEEEHLREAVEKLIVSPELRGEMGSKGRERVLKSFNPGIQIKKVMEIALAER